eukprot:255718_1
MAKQSNINDTRIDVDICFVCDCTNTMDDMIAQVLTDITNLVATVKSKLKAQLRVAFVAYRDYPSHQSLNPESRIECYDFTSDLTQFIDFLQQIKTDGGGGDRCEDVLGGLQASVHLKWQSPTKVLFHICDDPPHGLQFHEFYDEIEENRLQMMEFISYDTETCKDIFGLDSWQFAMFFQFENQETRLEKLEQYIKTRKDERDRFPDQHKDDPDHNEIFLAMKNKNIQYHIAKKTMNVDKMIQVFKSSALQIGYNVETSELTACSQLFGAVYDSISSAIMISKEVEHTQLIQQRARRLFLDAKQNVVSGMNYRVTLCVAAHKDVIVQYFVDLYVNGATQTPQQLELITDDLAGSYRAVDDLNQVNAHVLRSKDDIVALLSNAGLTVSADDSVTVVSAESQVVDEGHVFKVYCGIDFGTDGTAFAYCLPDNDKVYIPEWEDGRIVDTKLKTNILLDASNNYQCVAFGQSARDMYMRTEISDDDEDDDEDSNEEHKKKSALLFFEKFKMALYELSKDTESDLKVNDEDHKQNTEKQDIYEQLISINGEPCESKTVIIEALKFVKKNALDAMNGWKHKRNKQNNDDDQEHDVDEKDEQKERRGLNVTVNECQWALTVPAIWSNRSKGIMLHCAEKAGLLNPKIPNHLIIAFEPDCASIAIQHEYMTKKKNLLTRRIEIALARNKRREEERKAAAKMGFSKAGSKMGLNMNKKSKPNDDNSDNDDDDWIRSPKSPPNKPKSKKIETPGCDDSHLLKDKEEEIDEDDTEDSSFNADKNFFVRGEKYILADLGGGTADIACHEILADYKGIEKKMYAVREIYRPSGGPYGSTYIDNAFMTLLSKVISKRWMKEFKLNEPHKYIELLSNFQFAKVNFWKKHNIVGKARKGVSDHSNVRVPFEFIAFMEEKIEAIADAEDEDNEVQSLEHLFSNYSNDTIGIEREWMVLEGEYLQMKNRVWEYLFDLVVIPICDHIEQLVDKLAAKHHRFEYLLMAGGFCESNYVKHALFNRFGMNSKHKLRIVIPRRPILQVVTGAALWCKHQCCVRQRVIRDTIGFEVRESLNDFEERFNQNIFNEETEEKNEMMLFDHDWMKDRIVLDQHLNKRFVDAVFHRFVAFGDEIAIDDPPIIQFIKPVDDESECIEIKLFEFEHDAPIIDYGFMDIMNELNGDIFDKINNEVLNEHKVAIVSYFIEHKIDGEMLWMDRRRREIIAHMIAALKVNGSSPQVRDAFNRLYCELCACGADDDYTLQEDVAKLFTDHRNCKLLASKKVALPKEWMDNNNKDIPIAFFFGDTQIQVYFGIEGIHQKDALIKLDYSYYHA